MRQPVLLIPRDPMMFRDGRPFEMGSGARSLLFPTPSTIAGTLRTRTWPHESFADAKEPLLAITHKGPFLATEVGEEKWELAFPAPLDAVVYDQAKGAHAVCRLCPRKDSGDAGSDLPELADGEQLAMLSGARSEKASSSTPMFWSWQRTSQWLANLGADPLFVTSDQLGLPALPLQPRLHVQMDAATPGNRQGKEGMLFRTSNLEFDYDPEFHLAPRQRAHRSRDEPRSARKALHSVLDDPAGLLCPAGVGTLGGEGRIAEYAIPPADLLPRPPETSYPAGARVRLQLVTPGAFALGWRPKWITGGSHPDFPGLKLKLIAAAIGRRIPISGFDMTQQKNMRFRATRFLAPAGSVLFCEVVSGNARDLWLRSICDLPQDCRDGFGLVLTGGWQWQ